VKEAEMELNILIRLRCPKCRKEFQMPLKKFVPSGSLKCFSCGTMTTFNADKAGKVQTQVKELEALIEDIQERFD
jgi:hypothetical protein